MRAQRVRGFATPHGRLHGQLRLGKLELVIVRLLPGPVNGLCGRGMREVTPVVVNGVMYVTSGNDGFALDARTGRALWHSNRRLTSGLIEDASQHHNRGIAVWHSRVYMETDDAHLLSMDARSGGLIW